MEIKVTIEELSIIVRALEKEHYNDLRNDTLSTLLSRLIDDERRAKNY